MPTTIPPDDAKRALDALGVTQTELDLVRQASFEQAKTLLKNLKIKAHRQYKKLALELHPDRTQGDQAKAEFFVLLGRVLEEFDKVTVQAAPVMPQIRVTYGPNVTWVTPHTWQQVSTTAATTTVSTAGFTSAQVFRVVRMRPK
jgi:hypothetical protein